MLIDDPQLGDYVIVHAGFAIHKIDETAAMESLQLLRQAAAAASDLEDAPPE
jgi:hydrogenase expression/formation protein HypC